MTFAWWMVTAVANVVMVVIYAAIAGVILLGIARGRQWRTNPIAVATAAIFVTCTVGHGAHLVDALWPAIGGHADITLAARATFSDPLLVAWDVATAATAVYYWTLRSRVALIYRGAALCEDMAQRQKQAADLHGTVVETLARAKAELDAGHREAGRAAIDESLAASKRIITSLLAPERETRLRPGQLRRTGG